MRKLFLIIFISSLVIGCKDPNGFVTVSGKITNSDDVKELIISSKNYSKKITLKDDGTFKDTLKVTKGLYSLSNGINKTFLFLNNGYHLKIHTNSDFSNIAFKGKGKESNDYIKKRIAFSKTDMLNPKKYFELERKEFDKKLEEFKQNTSSNPEKRVDSMIVAEIQKDDKRFIEYITKNYEAKHAALVKFAPGRPSPKFNDLENYKGGTTSLDDFKGKYVYIDVWATWCGPCKAQIPYLKKVDEQYHGKNIEFISISTDRQNKHQTWKDMIAQKEMSGVQLFAGNDNSFSQAYEIRGIPRFILIDPQGNIVDANAPRPSDPRLQEIFSTLDL